MNSIKSLKKKMKVFISIVILFCITVFLSVYGNEFYIHAEYVEEDGSQEIEEYEFSLGENVVGFLDKDGLLIITSEENSTGNLFDSKNMPWYTIDNLDLSIEELERYEIAKKIKKIVFNNKINAAKDSDYLFAYMENLECIEFNNNFNTSQVKTMCSMFQHCESIENIELSNLDTSNVTKMESTFKACKKLKSIDLSSFNTKNLVSMRSMFFGASSLEEIIFENFDTTNVTNMYSLFSGCENLKVIDLSNFKTDSLINMTSMFANCTLLEEIKFGANFNAQKVEAMNQTFINCSSLKDIDFSNFRIEKVHNFNLMFSGSGIQSIDLKNFDTSNASNMEKMFYKCTSLKNVNFGENFVLGTICRDMFANCSLLEELDFSKVDSSKTKNMQTLFSNCISLKSIDLSMLDFSNVENMHAMFNNCENITDINLSNLDTSKVTSLENLFYNCKKLENVYLTGFSTALAKSFRNMFSNCENLKNVDISSFDVSNVTTLYRMFYNCYKLEKLDLSSFTTNKVSTMQEMFYSCVELKDITFNENFDFSNVTNINGIFRKSGLNKDELYDFFIMFDTSKVENMSNLFSMVHISNNELNELLKEVESDSLIYAWEMFSYSSNYTNIDLSTINFTKLKSASAMFTNSKNLVSVNFGSQEIKDLEDMSFMFSGCSSLEEIDLNNFETSKVTNMEGMFSNCLNLKNIIGLENITTSIIGHDEKSNGTLDEMFMNCSKLEVLNLSSFKFSESISSQKFAYGCKNLKEVLLGEGFETFNQTEDVFYNDEITNLKITLERYYDELDTSYNFLKNIYNWKNDNRNVSIYVPFHGINTNSLNFEYQEDYITPGSNMMKDVGILCLNGNNLDNEQDIIIQKYERNIYPTKTNDKAKIYVISANEHYYNKIDEEGNIIPIIIEFDILKKKIKNNEIIFKSDTITKEYDGTNKYNLDTMLNLEYVSKNGNKIFFEHEINNIEFLKKSEEIYCSYSNVEDNLAIKLNNVKIKNASYKLIENEELNIGDCFEMYSDYLIFDNVGKIVDTTSPKLVSIKALPGLYQTNDTIRFILEFNEEVRFENSEVNLKFQAKDGENLYNLLEQSIKYQLIENEAFSKTKELTYIVLGGQIAMNGLKCVALEILGCGFVDASDNALNRNFYVDDISENFKDVYIYSVNALDITCKNSNNINNQNVTSDVKLEYTFSFEKEICDNSFTKDDIVIMTDGKILNNNIIENLETNDNKVFVLKINNQGIKKNQIQTINVFENCCKDIYNNPNLSMSYSIKFIGNVEYEDENIGENATNIGMGMPYDEKSDATEIVLKPILKTNKAQYKYMIGFKDQTFRPNAKMIRSEVAAIISRISNEYNEGIKYNTSIKFYDINENAWEFNYVMFTSKQNLMNGFENYYRPYDMMTRGEFAAVIVRLLDINLDKIPSTSKFKDIEDKWYEREANALIYYGYINGLPNGKFGGEEYITRAEVCKILNQLLNKEITFEQKEKYSAQILEKYKDLNYNSWYFEDVVKALVDIK